MQVNTRGRSQKHTCAQVTQAEYEKVKREKILTHISKLCTAVYIYTYSSSRNCAILLFSLSTRRKHCFCKNFQFLFKFFSKKSRGTLKFFKPCVHSIFLILYPQQFFKKLTLSFENHKSDQTHKNQRGTMIFFTWNFL